MTQALSPEVVAQRLRTLFIDPAAAGDNPVLAAQGVGTKIVVYGYFLLNNAATAQSVRFRSAANSKFPLMVFPAAGAVPNTPIFQNPTGHPLFECNENEALNVNLLAATAVGVAVQLAVLKI